MLKISEIDRFIWKTYRNIKRFFSAFGHTLTVINAGKVKEGGTMVKYAAKCDIHPCS